MCSLLVRFPPEIPALLLLPVSLRFLIPLILGFVKFVYALEQANRLKACYGKLVYGVYPIE